MRNALRQRWCSRRTPPPRMAQRVSALCLIYGAQPLTGSRVSVLHVWPAASAGICAVYTSPPVSRRESVFFVPSSISMETPYKPNH
ncbi:MAG: hypothetical protein HPY45_17365 [Anaerolineae bacterium]|nr:hypothetical protein [Anaerolineae bacterium]